MIFFSAEDAKIETQLEFRYKKPIRKSCSLYLKHPRLHETQDFGAGSDSPSSPCRGYGGLSKTWKHTKLEDGCLIHLLEKRKCSSYPHLVFIILHQALYLHLFFFQNHEVWNKRVSNKTITYHSSTQANLSRRLPASQRRPSRLESSSKLENTVGSMSLLNMGPRSFRGWSA